MGLFDGYYKGDKKKLGKKELEQKAKLLQNQNPYVFVQPEVVKKGKDKI